MNKTIVGNKSDTMFGLIAGWSRWPNHCSRVQLFNGSYGPGGQPPWREAPRPIISAVWSSVWRHLLWRVLDDLVFCEVQPRPDHTSIVGSVGRFPVLLRTACRHFVPHAGLLLVSLQVAEPWSGMTFIWHFISGDGFLAVSHCESLSGIEPRLIL